MRGPSGGTVNVLFLELGVLSQGCPFWENSSSSAPMILYFSLSVLPTCNKICNLLKKLNKQEKKSIRIPLVDSVIRSLMQLF